MKIIEIVGFYFIDVFALAFLVEVMEMNFDNALELVKEKDRLLNLNPEFIDIFLNINHCLHHRLFYRPFQIEHRRHPLNRCVLLSF